MNKILVTDGLISTLFLSYEFILSSKKCDLTS